MKGLRGWEKLLHQALLVGLEGFVLLGFGGDQGVEAAQARGDALLFGERRNWNLHLLQVTWAEVFYAATYCDSLSLPRKVWASQKDFQITPIQSSATRPESNQPGVENGTRGSFSDKR